MNIYYCIALEHSDARQVIKVGPALVVLVLKECRLSMLLDFIPDNMIILFLPSCRYELKVTSSNVFKKMFF